MADDEKARDDGEEHETIHLEMQRMDGDIKALRESQGRLRRTIGAFGVRLSGTTLKVAELSGTIKGLDDRIDEIHSMSQRTLNALGVHVDAEQEIDLRKMRVASTVARSAIWLTGAIAALVVILDLLYMELSGRSFISTYLHFLMR